jgi:hypothetical protein
VSFASLVCSLLLQPPHGASGADPELSLAGLVAAAAAHRVRGCSLNVRWRLGKTSNPAITNLYDDNQEECFEFNKFNKCVPFFPKRAVLLELVMKHPQHHFTYEHCPFCAPLIRRFLIIDADVTPRLVKTKGSWCECLLRCSHAAARWPAARWS